MASEFVANVAAGDLAVVVMKPPSNPHLLGVVVRVIEEAPPNVGLERTPFYRSWHVTSSDGELLLVGGREVEFGTCPDCALRRLAVQ